MESNKINKGLYDETLLIRLRKEDKEMLMKIADYYNMPNITAFVRELILNSINKYEKEREKNE